MTYEDLIKTWGGNSKKVVYKNHILWITATKRAKNNKVFYIGVFYYHLKPGSRFYSKVTSFESIHYDKVISRFERFVDEYCIDWRVYNSKCFKGYIFTIKKEPGKDYYLGTVQFHKNSTYKHLADTREEVERCCRNRISKVIYEKEKVIKEIKMTNSKEEKIKYLQDQLASISAELKKIKNEKDTWTYKGIVLEYGTDEELDTGYSVGRIKNAPKEAREFYGKIESVVKSDLENYIDELEKSAKLYLQLTGQEIARGEIELYPE